MALKRIALFVMVLAIPSFLPCEARAASFSLILDTLAISGPIEPDDELRFSEVAKNGASKIKRVRITSPGGNLESSLRISMEIQRLGIPVVVRSRCVSSCAFLMFISGSKRSIRSSGYLAFHEGTSFMFWRAVIDRFRNGAYRRTGDAITFGEIELANDKINSMMSSISSVYSKQSIDLDMVMRWHDATRPKLEAIDVSGTPDSRVLKFELSDSPSGCLYVVPDKKLLQSIGIDIDDYEMPPRDAIASDLGVAVSKIAFVNLENSTVSCK
jgi:hypothetical protein